MKRFFLILIVGLFFFGCNGGDPVEGSLQLKNEDQHYAFFTGDLYNVNSSISITGFIQKQENQQYLISLDYNVSLLMPDGSVKENIYSDKINTTSVEKLPDYKIDANFDLDSTFSIGDYKLIYDIKDNLNGSKFKFTTTKVLKLEK